MKICYVCSEYPPALHGGIGTYIQTLSRAIVKDGGEARVAGIYPQRFNLADYEEDSGVKVWRFKDEEAPISWVAGRYRLYRTIREWAARGEIQLVEVPDWEGYAALWPNLGVPVVTRLHGSLSYFASEMNGPLSARTAWLEKRSFHRSDFCCSTSAYTARRSEEVFGKRQGAISVLYCPVDMGNGHVGQRDPKRIVFAGTLTRKKGIIQLVKAWPMVLRSEPGAVLDVYGKDEGTDDGSPMIPYVQSLLDEKGNASVKFHGHIPTQELRKVYNSCGAAVFPSYAEAFSLAPVEAMSAGCPVIYSGRHSGPELMTDGVEGLLVDPDSEEQIAGAILRLMQNLDLAGRIGIAGRLRVEDQFATQNVLQRNYAFYQMCIDDFARRRGRPA